MRMVQLLPFPNYLRLTLMPVVILAPVTFAVCKQFLPRYYVVDINPGHSSYLKLVDPLNGFTQD